MKRSTIFVFFMICSISLLIGNINNVKAYNFDPSVEVGDEIVYEYYSTVETLTEITHVKVRVTNIQDEGGNTTVIEGYLFGSDDGGESFSAATQGPEDLGTLFDYSVDPSSPIEEGDFFVVPGTKIGEYVIEIDADITSGNATSIENDYGIEITGSPTANLTLVYDEDGIAIKYYRTNDEGIRNFDIYSINDKRYYIPGYPIYLIVGFIVLGILGIYFIRIRKNGK